MRDYVVIDFETGSAVNLKTAGVDAYSKDPSTHVQCLAWIWPKGEPEIWTPDQPLPAALIEHVARGGIVSAQNAPFELAIWANVLCRAPGWPPLLPVQTVCTMARARALGLPGGLAECALALRLDAAKDNAGHNVMLKLCRPRTHDPLTFWTPQTAPDLFRILYAYCKMDCVVQRELHARLTPLSPREQALWVLDQTINARGVPIDIENVKRAAAIVQDEKRELSARVHLETLGRSTATTVAALREWLQDEDLALPDMKKATLAKLLADPSKLAGKDAAKLVLEIRREASKVSTAKLTAMLRRVCPDNAARGVHQSLGANTGRYAGKGIQLQNLKRSTKAFDHTCAADLIEWLPYEGAATAIRLNYGSVMDAVSMSVRSFIKARPGRILRSCDYSNIEGRVLAWMAREEWKLEAFRTFDTVIGVDARGEPVRAGPDLYNVAYAESFGVPVTSVDDAKRQIGKVQELACGYQGGIGSYISMGANYAVVPSEIADAVKAVVDPESWEKAARKMPKMGTKFRYDLDPHAWTGLRLVVDKWRAANPNIVRLWHLTEQAAISAVENPGQITSAGRVHYVVNGDFLLCRLPSGRALAYPYPAMRKKLTLGWEEQRDVLKRELEEAPAEAKEAKAAELAAHIDAPDYEMKLSYWGVSSKAGSSKKWRQLWTYGGHLVENITQAIARDILTEAFPRLEAAGYPIIMHVHDEAVCEMPENKGSIKEMAHIMCAVEPWAHGLPIAAAGWSGPRYRK